MKKKIGDVFLNVVASGIMTVVLQLITYPFLARVYTSAEYGVILTVMGIVNTISSSFGGGINNTRLVEEHAYHDEQKQGDFNALALSSATIAAALCLTASLVIKEGIGNSLVLAVTGFFIAIRSYYCVAFRLNLNYKAILVCNIVTAIGYVVGSVLVLMGAIWPIAFFVGEAVGGGYTFFTSKLCKEGLHFTSLLSKTVKTFIFLLISSLVSNIVVYLDRLLLFPIMGDTAVSIYTVASILGKCVGILMLPISGVLLSYYAQNGYVMTRKNYYKQCAIMALLALIFVTLISPISPFFTQLLYPSLYDDAAPFIFLANTASIIGVLSNMLTPAVMRFAKAYWQIVIATIYGAIYLVLAVVLTQKIALLGFCYAALLSNISKCLVLILLGKEIGRNER